MTNEHFFTTIYRFTGPTLMGTGDEWMLKHNKIEYVIAFCPAGPVDPKGLFIYVTDGDTTYTVSKRTLESIDIVGIDWQRTKYMTHNQEVIAKLKAMNDYFNAYKSAIHNFPEGTFKTTI